MTQGLPRFTAEGVQIGNGRGFRVPGWFLAMAGAVIPVILAAYLLGGMVAEQSRTVRDLSARMCRVEFALHISPWPGCPVPVVAVGAMER
jgi:hypothetical protein